MDDQSKNNLDLIQDANKEMLDYFNKIYLSDLEEIQRLKTEHFEITVKIDELTKTKSLYSFQSPSRKSVFSPVSTDGVDFTRNKIIDAQIVDLREVRESLSKKISLVERNLKKHKKRLEVLTLAESSINDLVESDLLLEEEDDLEDEDGFVFLEKEEEDTDAITHGYNILMQTAFDNSFVSTLLDRNIRDNLLSISNKLEISSYLLSSDVTRAKLTLQDIASTTNEILVSLEDIMQKLNNNIDSSKPIWTLIEDYIMDMREDHQECLIETDIDCSDYDIHLHPIFTINLVTLLNIFFDNIYKHSNANRVEFTFTLSNDEVSVVISDNGVGIDEDYYSKTPWYSSLHRATEIIYLLSGTLDISGTLLEGTKIEFSFPVQE